MYYDYPEDEFYSDGEYQEQIDILKTAVRNSVKSEILEEMNRLRAENEKLQGIKEHFEEIERDFEIKKAECDRIVQNAEFTARTARLVKLMKDHKVVKWKSSRELVYGPKCQKCDKYRQVEVTLPSGRTVKDTCKCATKGKWFYYPKMYILNSFSDRYGRGTIDAYYKESKSNDDDAHYELYSHVLRDDLTRDEKETAIKELDRNVLKILFNSEEECQAVCDRLNKGLGNFMYTDEGKDIREIIKGEKPDES